jgi:4-hydroxy-2-oxoglutarate aldolase
MLGAKGAVPALANIAPRECVQIFDSYQRGEYDAARQLQLRLIRLNLAVTTRLGVPGLKAALDELGEFYGGPPRAPLMPLGEKERAEIRTILREAGLERQEPEIANQVRADELERQPSAVIR